MNRVQTTPNILGSYTNGARFGLTITVTLFFMLFSAIALANSITVKTDRQSVEMGDIITLMIETDFQTGGSQLDLTALEDQFDVLNKQQSNQIEIINGKYSSYTRWRVQILPKQVGKLVIPPFELKGAKSKPYPIQVKKAQYSDGNQPYFLEAEVDKKTVYVQEQVIYTLRFYHKGSLINGNIRPPKFDNALVESLKEQSVFGKTINGQQYTVYEWQYALFPQSSGMLSIPGPSFTGLLHMRGKQKGVRSVAKATNIEVLPAVKHKEPYWLPATDLSLSQSWENLPQTIHVGDSLRRIITLNVTGLKSTQLPTIITNNGRHYKVYADEAKEQQRLSEKGVRSVKIVSQAIVPTHEGTLVLPEENISWWNTKTQQFETATLESQELSIWPASTSIPPVTQHTQTPKITDSLPNSQTQPLQKPNFAHEDSIYHDEVLAIPLWVWPIIAATLIVLWLITLVILVRTRHQLNALLHTIEEAEEEQEEEEHHPHFDQHWCDLPLEAFYKELLRQLRDELNIKNVDAIENKRLKKAIFQLESHLYKGEKLGYDTQQIICDNWAALVTKENEKQEKRGQLDSLYGDEKQAL